MDSLKLEVVSEDRKLGGGGVSIRTSKSDVPYLESLRGRKISSLKKRITGSKKRWLLRHKIQGRD